MSWVSAPLADRPKTFQRLGQRAGAGDGGVGGFPLVHTVGAALIDHALGVAEDHVLRPHPHRLQQFNAGDGGGAGAVDHQFGIAQVAPGEVASIDETGGSHDGGAVLVVMEHRNVHQFAQPLLDDEALRRLDVFQVDAAEARAEIAHGVDEFLHVLGADFEVDAVHVGEALEQRDLAFHHRLGGDGAEIAETEDGGAVGDHGDHVALAGVVVGQGGIAEDVQAGLGDAGRIGQRQVARGGKRLGQVGGELAGRIGGVHRQRVFAGYPGCPLVLCTVSHGRSPWKFLSNTVRYHAPADGWMEASASQPPRGGVDLPDG